MVFTRLLMAMILIAAASGGGCTNSKMPGIVPLTPLEVARNAYNPYDPDLRCRSVNLLSAAPFGGEKVYVRLYGLLLDDPDPTVRAACAHALGLHGGPQHSDRLTQRLSDRKAFVRREVAQALQRIHSPEVVKPLLTTMAEDTDVDVRVEAAAALGQYAERRVFDALVRALEDPHYSVVAAARRSLETLTGYEFGTDGAMWLTWAKRTDDLFGHRKVYRWQPYEKPASLIQKVQFWKKSEPIQPRKATGSDDS
jgi:hypothetical protein